MIDALDKGKEIFIEEAYERLTDLENALLAMEETPEDQDLIDSVFRSIHTLKGSGSMFGFDKLAAFAHEIETVLDHIREGSIKATAELVALILSSHDQLKIMVESPDDDQHDQELVTQITDKLKTFLPNAEVQPEKAPEKPTEDDIEHNQESSFRIRFKPDENLFVTGSNPLLLINELRSMGKALVVAQTREIPSLDQINPESCYTYWDIILTTQKTKNEIKDVFIFVEDLCELTIEEIDSSTLDDPDDHAYKKLGEILVEKGDIKEEELNQVLNEQQPIGEILKSTGLVTEDAVRSALAEQQHVKQTRESRVQIAAVSNVRVSSEKLDQLVDLVGELVTVQARLAQLAGNHDDSDLSVISEEVETLTSELRDNTMSIRLLPIGTTFNKFKRLVRDLSHDLDKKIQLVTEGGDTELDKSVIEQLNDPLVHIIRNSVDHGIESPAEREKAGKPGEGTVRLSAVHSGAYVNITIEDDGAGLNKNKIREKAIEKGVISSDTELSNDELYNLIFAPGFSTAQSVTNVSGRGVGMDVVKRQIEALRGSVEVTSTLGKGTQLTMKLPLTLAIIDGLLVSIQDEKFVLPLSAVEECIELSREDESALNGKSVSNVRGTLIPFINLRKEFRISGTPPEIQQIVITEINGQNIGFVVDNVIGEHQTVIKSLGTVYKNIQGISGATILGDGTVALIIDLPQMFTTVQKEESEFLQ